MNHTINKSAKVFVAFLNDRPVALQAVLPQPHAVAKNLYRGHRAVCLPDYQGLSVGSKLIDLVASAYRGIGKRIISTTASPALAKHRAKNPEWKLLRKPSLSRPQRGKVGKNWQASITRYKTTFEYIGPKMEYEEAFEFIYSKKP